MRSVGSRTPGNKRNCQPRDRISILVNNQVSAINIALGIIKSIRSETHFFRKNGISELLEVPFHPNGHALQNIMLINHFRLFLSRGSQANISLKNSS